MSSDLANLHIQLGSPCGELPEPLTLMEWAAEKIRAKSGTLTPPQLALLRIIGEHLHVDEYNQKSREEALEVYFKLYDSVIGREQ